MCFISSDNFNWPLLPATGHYFLTSVFLLCKSIHEKIRIRLNQLAVVPISIGNRPQLIRLLDRISSRFLDVILSFNIAEMKSRKCFQSPVFLVLSILFAFGKGNVVIFLEKLKMHSANLFVEYFRNFSSFFLLLLSIRYKLS